MKKIILTVAAVFALTFANAQDKDKKEGGNQTSEGKWLIEANTGFGRGVGSTAFALTSEDGNTSYNIGAEAGYFVMDNLAIKAGLGYGDDGADTTTIAYKVGAKYYVKGMIPVELSYNGVSVKGLDENPSYVGLQAGYAWFLGENVSIEPGLRYNYSLNSDFYENALQFNIGFALHF
ncbi:hypothetical protein QWY90_11425 [Flavobacterium paronense]|uniref:Outer membrane protein beta-barrel domain-containing protein n=1 Tax=Flavobacterium paronense TaxID=1392775 RepID=A0ABV5GCG9_9FLAO|nr:hypothetical protein [Flavobacterium paronense]MDN3677919.1 hypothetical protein [Flavobacterium paronense]